ncbi:MAG: hypothetical protein HZA50_17695 [Planctomycetes bacterium]|nr:hypothetical protein [Planctomycetota bacterium]
MTEIRKALIPIAGLGLRLKPVSTVVPKALLPLVDSAGRIRTVVHVIMAQAIAAGAQQIALVVAPGHMDMLRRYFVAARKEFPGEIPEFVEYIIQPSPLGLGEAVARAADFVGNEPFLLMVGDHVYRQAPGRPCCASQVVGAFAKHPGAVMVGAQIVDRSELSRVGVARGRLIGDGVYVCEDFVEKPDFKTAQARLTTPDLPKNRFLAQYGPYIFTPRIFGILARLVVTDRPLGQEVTLTEAQASLVKDCPGEYYMCLLEGRALNTGEPEDYARAFKALNELQ